MHKPYFKDQGGPPPLSVRCRRRVRLEEVDVLGIVWHGRYAGYLEDGREELGRRYGLSYLDFREAGVVLPLRTLHLDYLIPLRYLEEFEVESLLHWHEAAKLNIEYLLYNQEGQLASRAYSVQLMVDLSGVLQLEPPPFYLEFRRRWQEGLLDV